MITCVPFTHDHEGHPAWQTSSLNPQDRWEWCQHPQPLFVRERLLTLKPSLRSGGTPQGVKRLNPVRGWCPAYLTGTFSRPIATPHTGIHESLTTKAAHPKLSPPSSRQVAKQYTRISSTRTRPGFPLTTASTKHEPTSSRQVAEPKYRIIAINGYGEQSDMVSKNTKKKGVAWN